MLGRVLENQEAIMNEVGTFNATHRLSKQATGGVW